jgi:nucleoside-diphosphate kinase
MAIERTFAIVKPDAVAKNAIGAIIAAIEHAGLRVIGLRYLRMSQVQAEGFYAVHRQRPFFRDLVAFMTSGPSVVMALEGDNAILRWRELMGPTDATKAPAGTIRASFGTNIERNAVHGSDGPDTARFELSWFFAGADLGLPEQAK